MARNILILGASYGSLLGTKLLMAGHNVTLVCRKKTAELINRDGTEIRIKLRDEAMHRAIFSRDLTLRHYQACGILFSRSPPLGAYTSAPKELASCVPTLERRRLQDQRSREPVRLAVKLSEA